MKLYCRTPADDKLKACKTNDHCAPGLDYVGEKASIKIA
jgi:hypothetical protein